MMSESRRCMFLLLSTIAGWLSVSGAGTTQKYVCPGYPVQVFQNIKFNPCNAVVTLSRNGDRNTEIAMWSYQNCTLNPTISQNYNGRVFLDQNGTITMNDFHHFDQAKYVATSKVDQLPTIYEVQLHVMVAPKEVCKPMIEKLGNSLIARLKADDCGIPVAIPYWKGDDAVANTNEAILKLSQGKEAGKYSACIKGPALDCATNLTPEDYCSSFTIEGSNSPTITSETCNTVALIAVSIVSVILFIWAIAVSLKYIQIIRRRTFNGEQTVRLLEIPQSGTRQLEIPQLWKNHFDILKWEDIKQLLNNDQRQGLQAYCDKLKTLGEDQHQISEIRCDEIAPKLATHQAANSKSTQLSELELEIEESRNEHQTGTDPEKVREVQELRHAAMCKICFARKMSVCFMPCKHMATCAECSIPLNMCPVCRATINEKMNIRFE